MDKSRRNKAACHTDTLGKSILSRRKSILNIKVLQWSCGWRILKAVRLEQ